MTTMTEPLTDDLNLGLDPDAYEPPKMPMPPPKGTYLTKLVRQEWDVDKNTGSMRTPPQIQATFEIAEGQYAGRKATFQRISSRQFGNRTGGSLLNDLLASIAKAIGHTGAVKGLEAITTLLDQAIGQGTAFKARWDWDAYDSDYINGIRDTGTKPTNEQYNAARIRGQRNFDSDGTAVGPSTNTLTANAAITGFIPG